MECVFTDESIVAMESVHLSNSDKFPTLCTLTVDGHPPTAHQHDDDSNWRLTYCHPHDGSRDYLRLHTLDIYFWTLDDAKLFLATTGRLLAPSQLALASSQEHGVSSVVQQLENAAVGPSYRNSQMSTPGVEPINLSPPLPPPPSSQAPQAATMTTAPAAPIQPTSGSVGQREPSAAQQPTKSSETERNYAPVAYDPTQQSSKPSDATHSSAPEMHHPVQQPTKPVDTTQGYGSTVQSQARQPSNPPDTAEGYASTARDPGQQPSSSPEKAQSYAPMSYNPAAPAAPEPVQHREKTPPPADPATGVGTAHPPVPGHGTDSFASSPHESAPRQGHNAPTGTRQLYSSPPPSAGLPQHAQVTPHAAQHNQPGSLSFSPPPTTTATSGPTSTGGQPGTMAFDPPPQDPNVHLYHQGSSTQTPAYGQYQPNHQEPYQDSTASQTGAASYASYPHPHQQPQPPMGGYTEFSYNQQHQQPPQGNPYSVHSQVYRPTGAEAMGHSQDQSGTTPAAGSKPGMITENAMRVEKGVNRLMKKLEKKI